MATISGLASSYQLPQYIGSLFQKSKRPNAFLRTIGGLNGNYRTVQDTQFAMGVDYVLPTPSQPTNLEGAAPSYVEQDTGQSTNTTQIFQEGVQLAYSRMAKTGSISGLAQIPGAPAGGMDLVRPGTIEFQVARKMQKISQDVNYSFLQGAYTMPANNSSARTTSGLITAVATHLYANGGTNRALTVALLEAALRDAMADGAFNQGDELYLFAEKAQFDALQTLYKAVPSQFITPETQRVGVALRQIGTTYAILNIAWDPDVPLHKMLICQPTLCRVVATEIPQKGVLFAEQLAQTGSAENWQLYGELGLDYTQEFAHLVVADLT